MSAAGSMSQTEEDIDLDWEEWNGRGKFAHHMLAGSFAGWAEHVSIFPIDTIKTHLQCERCGSSNIWRTWTCAEGIIAREGIGRLWRGVSATFAGCIPAHAAYFSVYEAFKSVLGMSNDGHYPVRAAICGAGAAMSHDLFMTPFDTVKQRMQLGYYSSMRSAAFTIAQKEGFRALYIALPATLAMNLPYGMIMVATNESCKTYLNPSGQYSLSTCMLSGSVAGAVAAALTNPLDIVKTRLQTNNLMPFVNAKSSSSPSSTVSLSLSSLSSLSPKSKHGLVTRIPPDVASTMGIGLSCRYSSSIPKKPQSSNAATWFYTKTLQTALDIFRENGIRGYFRGVTPRILQHAPAVAISWTAYESVKAILDGNLSS